MIVVDTSVLIDFFKGKKTKATQKFREIEEQQVPFLIPGICCQEVLQGARNQREWKLLYEYLTSQRILNSNTPLETHVRSAQVYYDCRRKGYTVSSPIDCWIAQLVYENKSYLLQCDRDFEKIAKILDLGLVPVG